MIERTRVWTLASVIMVLSLAIGYAESAEPAEEVQASSDSAGATIGPIYLPTEAQNISGVWWIQSYSPAIQLVGGGALPLTESGQAQYEANMSALQEDPLRDEARRLCLPDGVPRILGNPYPFQIIQTPGQVNIAYELNRVMRRVMLDIPMPSEELLENIPFYSGYSIGRWEDETLVIETAGYKDKTFIDATGVPHSGEMRTVERVRKLSDDTLEIVVTVNDPAIFTAAWEARFVSGLHPEVRLQQYVCGDEHRDIAHIPGVNLPN